LCHRKADTENIRGAGRVDKTGMPLPHDFHLASPRARTPKQLCRHRPIPETL